MSTKALEAKKTWAWWEGAPPCGPTCKFLWRWVHPAEVAASSEGRLSLLHTSQALRDAVSPILRFAFALLCLTVTGAILGLRRTRQTTRIRVWMARIELWSGALECKENQLRTRVSNQKNMICEFAYQKKWRQFDGKFPKFVDNTNGEFAFQHEIQREFDCEFTFH